MTYDNYIISKALLASQNRQKELVRERLEAKKHEQEQKEYEHETANELLKMMERTDTFLQDKTDKEKDRQGNLVCTVIECVIFCYKIYTFVIILTAKENQYYVSLVFY